MQYLKPNWPAPHNILALSTTRQEGHSAAPYGSFNLARHVGDLDKNVEKNRLLLTESLQLSSDPIWLEQVHSNQVVNIDEDQPCPITADAAIATTPHRICVVMTADCLPILLCNQKGTKVAAIHAGWRGLAHGIIENTIHQLGEPPTELLAWLGPAIGPSKYEVSQDFFNTFMDQDVKNELAFQYQSTDKWLANLYLLATHRLMALGLKHIYGGEYCTYSDEKNFYSYRRDQGVTGRIATLIWLNA